MALKQNIKGGSLAKLPPCMTGLIEFRTQIATQSELFWDGRKMSQPNNLN